MNEQQIIALLRGLIAGLEAGEVAAEQLDGVVDLEILQEASEQGWDQLDAVIAAGKAEGH